METLRLRKSFNNSDVLHDYRDFFYTMIEDDFQELKELIEVENWREEMIKSDLSKINGFCIDDLNILNKFDDDVIRRVLLVLLEWACYPQNDTGIMLGRNLISKVPKECLEKNIVAVVKNDFEYTDFWNYRRLLEAVTEFVPECKNEILQINRNSQDPDIIETIEEYSD